VLGSIDPDASVIVAAPSTPAKSAVTITKSKNRTSGVVAGPLALTVPRRNQVAQSSANSRRSPQAPWDL
jgi:hypothetical protein